LPQNPTRGAGEVMALVSGFNLEVQLMQNRER